MCDAQEMFDAVVIAGTAAEPAARTFAGLVEGVVEGVVQRVILASLHDGDDLRGLADAAGCRAALGLAPGAMGAALAGHLATTHVLAFEAGALLAAGWADELRQDLQCTGGPAADTGLALRPASPAARLGLAVALACGLRVPIAHGILVPRARLTDGGFDGRSGLRAGRWSMARLTVHRAAGG